MPWILWLILAVLLGVGEFLTLTFSLGLLAIAALVAAVIAGVGGGLLAQLIGFALTGAAGLLVIRPIARRLATTPISKDGSDALLGRTAVVLKEVSATGGLIKLAGDEWSARSYDDTHTIPAGSTVEVMEIDGARAVVYPRDLLP